MPGQDHNEEVEPSRRSEDEVEALEDDLADDFLRVPLPEKGTETARNLNRKIGEAIPKRSGGDSYLEVKDRVGGGGLAWGESPVEGKGVEAVWDDDPTQPMEEVIPGGDGEEEDDEDGAQTRTKKKRKKDAEYLWGWQQRTTLWWVLSGMVAIAVVGIFLVQMEQSKMPPVTVVEPDRFVSQVALEDTPVSELLALGQSAVPQLVGLLKEMEGSPDQAAQVLVRGRESVSKMSEWRARTGARAGVKENGVIGLMAAGFGEQGYLLMNGLRDDYTKYLAYFVESDGVLRVDWEATVGYCALLPEQVTELGVGEEAEMRATASPSSFYTDVFPEADYACFLLSHVERERYAWGYVLRESAEYELLAAYLGSPVTMMTAGRVRIRVARGPEGALPKQVVVSKVLGSDWVESTSKADEAGAVDEEGGGG